MPAFSYVVIDGQGRTRREYRSPRLMDAGDIGGVLVVGVHVQGQTDGVHVPPLADRAEDRSGERSKLVRRGNTEIGGGKFQRR